MVQAIDLTKPASLDSRILDHVAELLRLGAVVFIPTADPPPPGLLELIEEQALKGCRITFLSAGVPRGPSSIRQYHRIMIELRPAQGDWTTIAGEGSHAG